jgi:polyhydroxyalkanoate synthase subunit PhaC
MNAADGGTPGASGAAEALATSARVFAQMGQWLQDAVTSAARETDPASQAERLRSAMQGLQPQLAAAWGTGPWGQAAWSGDGAAPALGPLREQQRLHERVQTLSAQYLRQQAALGALWAAVLQAAATRFAERVAPTLATVAADPRRLYDTWIDCAEDAFAQAAHGSEWIDAQTALVNTGAQLRLAQRAILETAARQLDLPTRSELDAVHRQLDALRRELRTVQPLPGEAPQHRAEDANGGTSARDRVWQCEKATLYRYAPLGRPAGVAPVLICYALVNRPYMMDLQPDRSLIRRLLERGLDVYLLDWGYPDRADHRLQLDDYINRYLDGAVRHVLAHHGLPSLNLLGVCQGGAFSLCYTALHPQNVRGLVTMVTPVDFHTPENLLSRWIRGIDVDTLVDATGNVPGELLNAAYLSLMPFRLTQQKYVGLLDMLHDPAQVQNFMRMEKWIFDSPDQAGEAFRQFAKAFFQENRLLRGTLELGGRTVNLRDIVQPVLNVFAHNDHLVPPSASRPLGPLLGSTDYETLELDVGHIGMYVSARSQQQLPEAIAAWLKERA